MYQLNDAQMFCDVSDGCAIVINVKTGIYYGMNPLGTQVFELLIKGHSPAQLLQALKDLPDTPPDMEQRLSEFVQRLVGYAILIDGPSAESAVSLASETAAADGFSLDVSEYADVQDLLQADPIHDVQTEVGWQPVLKADSE